MRKTISTLLTIFAVLVVLILTLCLVGMFVHEMYPDNSFGLIAVQIIEKLRQSLPLI